MIPIVILAINNEDDKEFITRLFLENQTMMYVTAVKLMKDYHLARDMVSQSCVTMIDKIEYLRAIDIEKRSSYILSIVKNNSLIYLRKIKREKEFLMEEYPAADYKAKEQEDIDSRLIAEADMQALRIAMSKVHRKDCELLHMKYFEKLSDKVIAERLGIRAASVRYYLTKARRNVGSELDRGEKNV